MIDYKNINTTNQRLLEYQLARRERLFNPNSQHSNLWLSVVEIATASAILLTPVWLLLVIKLIV